MRPKAEPLLSWLLSLAIVVLASLTFSLERWQAFANVPLIIASSDHSTLSSMYLKDNDPELFANDYIFSKKEYLDFYTPSFHSLASLASTEPDEQTACSALTACSLGGCGTAFGAACGWCATVWG
ncbi:MAG: hypothetical protein RML73_16085 [Anaerolineae bacterium]|nr:hypothetical protein [Anaerolineae bacterium]